LSVAQQVLTELKSVFKADAGLELNVSKTSILPSKGVTAQAAFDMAQDIMQATPTVVHLSKRRSPRTSFCPEGFIGIPSALKVSLALADLLSLMPLYGVLWLKHVGIS
jgi:hypothetical protein